MPSNLNLVAFFLVMKNSLLIFSLFCISIVTLAQEKAKFKKQDYWVKSIAPSAFPILDNVYTQGTYFKIAPNILLAEKNLKRDFFNIKGFIKNQENNDLKIYVDIQTIDLIKQVQDSTFDNQTRKYYPTAKVYFKVNIAYEVKFKNQVLWRNDYVASENIHYTNGKGSFIQYEKDATSEFGDQIENIADIALKKIQEQLNQKVGYYLQDSKETFFWLTNKEHPEYSQMLAFENEMNSQLSAVNYERGLNRMQLLVHLGYLESLLTKYQPSKENEKIRFIVANNLAQAYFLLEDKTKGLYYADLLIKNGFRESYGFELINKYKNLEVLAGKTRTHGNRFGELSKLGYKLQQEEALQKEEAKQAFFEKIARDEADWEQEKVVRSNQIEQFKINWFKLIDSSSFQNNADILQKVIQNLGGASTLKGIEKIHTTSQYKFEDSNIPVFEDKWSLAFTNFLLKKRMPDNYLFVINNVEAWKHDDRVRGEKWKKISSSEYTENIDKLLPIYLLTGIRFDLWNKLEQQSERFINDKLCWHLSFTEKEMSSQNRIIPKQEYHFYFDKTDYSLVSTETIFFEDGKKISKERKIFTDYRETSALNNGKLPHRIQYQVEDYFGESFFEEIIEKVEINSGFSNRIFIKEVYIGGFK